MDTGLLIARLVFGSVMAAHGAQKLFGWFGGHGIAGTGNFFDSLGFRPGRLLAVAAGLGEVSSGLLVASGLFGPVGPARHAVGDDCGEQPPLEQRVVRDERTGSSCRCSTAPAPWRWH